MQFYAFSIGRIPVHLSVWALVLVGWLAFRSGDVIYGLVIAVAVLGSILIHELGHAVVAARYGLSPAILLHALGGTTQHARAQTDRQDALIIAAGPGIQIAVGVLVLIVWLVAVSAAPDLAQVRYLPDAVWSFLYISLFWGFLNLLPMWPMDGGKLFRLGLLHLIGLKPVQADRITHITGIVFAVAAFLAFWLLIGGFLFLVLIIFGMIALQNFQALREGQAAGPVRPDGKAVRGLLQTARQAFQEGRWAEAARLGHQIRAEPSVPDHALGEIFEMIALSHIFDGKLEEGVRFARRAPDTPRLIEAQVKALVALDRRDEARQVLNDRGEAIPDALRSELRAQIG